jgi:hypothetical protein
MKTRYEIAIDCDAFIRAHPIESLLSEKSYDFLERKISYTIREFHGLSDFVYYWSRDITPLMRGGFSVPEAFTFKYWKDLADRLDNGELKTLLDDMESCVYSNEE